MVARSFRDRCECCQGLDAQTPLEIYNRPGLDDISYRSGDFFRFKQSMLARLSSPGPDRTEFSSALLDLKTREDDDLAIALLDCWAIIADILTFYQERIANESYLRTAKERISLMHLARQIGYRLRPGVAASTCLAFTLDELPKTYSLLGLQATSIPVAAMPSTYIPEVSKIELGIKVQSMPGPGEKAQTFETDEEIQSRAEWNDIKPRLTRSQEPTDGKLFLQGTATGLNPGDGVLFKVNGTGFFAVISAVTPLSEKTMTEVEIQVLPGFVGNVDIPSSKSLCNERLNEKIGDGPITEPELQARAKAAGLQVKDIFDNLRACKAGPDMVMVFRARAAVFGHNAPNWQSLPSMLRDAEPIYTTDSTGKVLISKTDGPYKGRKDKWADGSLQTYVTFLKNVCEKTQRDSEKCSSYCKDIYLDNIYPGIAKGSIIVLRDDDNKILSSYEVRGAKDLSISDFTLSSKVTVLTLDRNDHFDKLIIRNTAVYAQSELLPLARMEEDRPFLQKEPPEEMIELDDWIEGLRSGQKILVLGEDYLARGTRVAEIALIEKVDHTLTDEGCTRIFVPGLKHRYVRSTVSIRANVSSASHGETKQEILGSGDAGLKYQKFILRQPPLTYLSSSSPSGIKSTLEVRVNEVLWQVVQSLFDRGPNDRVYVTGEGDDGRTTVQFGDGKTGARLPTGRENIRAKYRSGIGTQGLVSRNKLSMLLSRPLGIKEVTNPLATEGGADPESIEEARSNAPFRVIALDRIVSLQDYEDFARSFAGIAKAHATWTWTGHGREILITVAGPKGAEIDEKSPVRSNLCSAILKTGDHTVPINIQSYTKSFFRIAASIRIEKDHLKEIVLGDMEKALRSRFSFEARSLGQSVALSEVVATIQGIYGVEAVSVTKLYRSEEGPGKGSSQPDDLVARVPKAGSKSNVIPSELIILDPSPLADIEVMIP
ncbi:MAG TPA: putative baseplate assembly protein [Methanothrix soehngenii]|nr:putative baseplate assembly protein [Methanothrix soehngenii]